MNPNRLLLIATALALLSACAAPRKPPPPVAAPPPRPAPAPIAAPPPPANWRDVPITQGEWTYSSDAHGTLASFAPVGATALLGLRCDRAGGRINLARAGQATGPVPLTVTTTSLARTYSAAPSLDAAQPLVSMPLSPRDPILDAIAFSRGRFMVEVAGLPTLYVPAWPEVARVIEDCR